MRSQWMPGRISLVSPNSGGPSNIYSIKTRCFRGNAMTGRWYPQTAGRDSVF
jgi:hypothetical protein